MRTAGQLLGSVPHLVVSPDADSVAAIGKNVLDPAQRPASARAGRAQAAKVAPLAREIWAVMSERRISWSLLVVAVLLLIPVGVGVTLLTYDGGAALGWALIGFFGAGVVVLGRKALTGR